MRGKDTWALAVRRPTNDIYIEENKVKGLAAKYPLFRKPLFRGVAALGRGVVDRHACADDSANQALEEDEKLTTKQMALSMTLAFVIFIGIFIVLPTLGVNFFGGEEHQATIDHVRRRRGRRPRRDLRRLPGRHLVHQGDPARLHVPRRRAQDDRRVTKPASPCSSHGPWTSTRRCTCVAGPTS